MKTNFDCLFISYALIGEDYTSWVDLIPIRDLEEALKTKSKLTIKVVNLATMKFLKAECDAVGSISEHTYFCTLTFGPTEHNIKEEIEQGILTIEWEIGCSSPKWVDAVIYKAPANVYYREIDHAETIGCHETCNTKTPPTFAYLKHRDNRSKYFLFVNHKGIANTREEIFYVEEFEKNRAKFEPTVYAEIYNYVKTEVDKLTEFSIGTRWPNPWPKELHILYDVLKNEEQAAYFLSGLVQKAVMESCYEWTCCKVRLYRRERRTLYFYRTEKLKEE
jgi:hypothetical protein